MWRGLKKSGWDAGHQAVGLAGQGQRLSVSAVCLRALGMSLRELLCAAAGAAGASRGCGADHRNWYGPNGRCSHGWAGGSCGWCLKGHWPGWGAVGLDRFFTVLRQSGLLLAPLPKEYPQTTNSSHCLPVFKNLVKDQAVSRNFNEVWVSDLTYLRTAESFLYLALVTDKYSRKIVGYHCGETLAAAGCAGLGDGFERPAAGGAPDPSFGSGEPVLPPRVCPGTEGAGAADQHDGGGSLRGECAGRTDERHPQTGISIGHGVWPPGRRPAGGARHPLPISTNDHTWP